LPFLIARRKRATDKPKAGLEASAAVLHSAGCSSEFPDGTVRRYSEFLDSLFFYESLFLTLLGFFSWLMDFIKQVVAKTSLSSLTTSKPIFG